jgi:hypothetical protein
VKKKRIIGSVLSLISLPIHIFTITVFAFCELTIGTKKYCFNHVLTGRVGTVDVERVFPNDLFN